MCKREHCHCLCLQETHRPTNLTRPKIAGMSLVAEHPHNKYGSAILIRDDLKVDNFYERVQGTVELITIVMSGIVVHSVYQPPNNQFVHPALGHRDLPHIVIRDFNNHGTFNSARWKIVYNPDLIFASGSIVNMCKKSIMDPIPLTARSVLVPTQSWYHKLYLSDDVLTL